MVKRVLAFLSALLFLCSFYGCLSGSDSVDPTDSMINTMKPGSVRETNGIQGLSVEYVAELHNNIVHHFKDNPYGYKSYQDIIDSDFLKIIEHDFIDTSLFASLDIPSFSLFDSTWYFDADTMLSDLRTSLAFLVASLKFDSTIAAAVSDVVDHLEGNKLQPSNDITKEMDYLAELTNNIGDDLEMAVVGSIYGSYYYWTDQWSGGSPPTQPVNVGWLGGLADAGGAMAGAAMGMGLGSVALGISVGYACSTMYTLCIGDV